MKRYLIAGVTLLTLCTAFTNLIAEAAESTESLPNTANGLVNFESEPSTVVAGKVCIITGDYVESQVDFASAGIDSFVLHRTYSPSSTYYGRYTGDPGGYWDLNHQGYISESFENEKIEAFFQDENGRRMKYSARYKHWEMNTLTLG
jgi:hypothetical protein